MGRTSNAKERLLQGARELMFSQGFAAASVHKLCMHARVEKGSFYHFFPSKRDLTIEALDEQWEDVTKALLERSFRKDIPALDRIERFFDLIHEEYAALFDATGSIPGCPFGNLALELSTQEPAIRRKIENVFQNWAGYFEDAIIEARDSGAIAVADPASRAQAILAYLEGMLLLAKTTNDMSVIKRLGRDAIRLVTGFASEQAISTKQT